MNGGILVGGGFMDGRYLSVAVCHGVPQMWAGAVDPLACVTIFFGLVILSGSPA